MTLEKAIATINATGHKGTGFEDERLVYAYSIESVYYGQPKVELSFNKETGALWTSSCNCDECEYVAGR